MNAVAKETAPVHSKRWHLVVDGNRQIIHDYADAVKRYDEATGEHVVLCRSNGTVIHCKGSK